MNLKETQIAFKNFLLDNSPAMFQANPLSSLNIYKKNYYSNLHSALDNKFTTFSKYSNKRVKLYNKYIELNQSISGNLDSYGDGFPQFLSANGLDIEAKLANLDLFLFKTQDYSQEKSLDPNLLSHIQPHNFDRLYFIFAKSLSLITISYESYKIWLELNKNTTSNGETANICETNILIHLVINNQNINAQVIMAKPDQYICLERIKEKDNLLLAAEKALELDKEFNLGDFLKFCFKNRLIVGYEYLIN